MKWLMFILLLVAGCVRPSTTYSGRPVQSYEEALAIVMQRPEIRKRLDYIKQFKDRQVFLDFENGGYTKRGSDVVLADSWQVNVMIDSPERRVMYLPALYVSRKDGRVYVDGGLEPPVLLEDDEAWLKKN